VAEPETKVFGSADPTLACTSSGFQFSDTAATVVTGSLARPGETVAGGPYAITRGTLASDRNYTIQFTGSTLTITPATPLVTVSAPGGTYNGDPIAAVATVTGFGGTATPELEGVTPTLTYYAGSGTSGTNLGSAAPSAAGTYTVVARLAGSADFAAAQSQPATVAIATVGAAQNDQVRDRKCPDLTGPSHPRSARPQRKPLPGRADDYRRARWMTRPHCRPCVRLTLLQGAAVWWRSPKDGNWL
jgi:hypothetical protein